MAEKEITLEQLMAFQSAGAKISQRERTMIVANIQPPDKNLASVKQFGELLAKLDEIVADNSSRAKSDRQMSDAHFQLFSELQTALLGLAKREDKPHPAPVISVEPLKTVLGKIDASIKRNHEKPTPPARPVARPSYRFEVVRTQQGFINEIIATPIAATKH